MLANADLLDYEEDDFESNHINNNAFNDYKLSSKNSFGGQSDLVAIGDRTADANQQVLATSARKHQK